MKRLLWLLCGLLPLATGLAGCEPGTSNVDVSSRTVKVVATTGMVADTVRNVGGERVEVTALMGPGVDPHLYKASEGDFASLREADAIFYNGLNLEGKMGDTFVKMASLGKATTAVTEAISPELLREPPEFQGHYDPHVWFDVELWSQTVAPVVETLAKLDPQSRSLYEANGEAYRKKLESLHAYCRDQTATIPKAQRVLITAHDAFGYFGRAYDMEVLGLQGISTLTEVSLRDVQRLVDVIVGRNIKAVFVESSVPQKSIEAVVEGCRARGHEVKIGGTLYSDALGEAGSPAGAYEGMVRHNVDTIVAALK